MASNSGHSSQASEDPVLQNVTFRLADETYGINVMQIQEVQVHRTMFWVLSIYVVMS